MPKISVIVPVYNTEKYLHRCIDSILAQTFSDFELLLIDDGSKDNSGRICDEYAAKDSRIRVFHKKNGGVSSARNLGLDNALGEWVTFVDSDDWVAVRYLENLHGHSLNGVDLVFSYATIDDGVHSRKENYPACLVKSNNLDEIFIKNDIAWHTSPWAKLYKMDLINSNKLKFIENVHIGEDLIFLYSYILYSNTIYISSDTDYIYKCNLSDSLTKRVFEVESEIRGLAEITTVVNRVVNHGQIRSVTSLNNTKWIIGHFTRRVLNALYYNGINDRKQREAILKSLDLEPYITSFNYVKGKEWLLRILLSMRCYFLYDFLRQISLHLKR